MRRTSPSYCFKLPERHVLSRLTTANNNSGRSGRVYKVVPRVATITTATTNSLCDGGRKNSSSSDVLYSSTTPSSSPSPSSSSSSSSRLRFFQQQEDLTVRLAIPFQNMIIAKWVRNDRKVFLRKLKEADEVAGNAIKAALTFNLRVFRGGFHNEPLFNLADSVSSLSSRSDELLQLLFFSSVSDDFGFTDGECGKDELQQQLLRARTVLLNRIQILSTTNNHHSVVLSNQDEHLLTIIGISMLPILPTVDEMNSSSRRSGGSAGGSPGSSNPPAPPFATVPMPIIEYLLLGERKQLYREANALDLLSCCDLQSSSATSHNENFRPQEQVDRGSTSVPSSLFNLCHFSAVAGDSKLYKLLSDHNEKTKTKRGTDVRKLGGGIAIFEQESRNFPRAVDGDGNTPALLAAREGQLGFLKLYADTQDPLWFLQRNQRGQGVHHLAAAKGQRSVFQYLLELSSSAPPSRATTTSTGTTTTRGRLLNLELLFTDQQKNSSLSSSSSSTYTAVDLAIVSFHHELLWDLFRIYCKLYVSREGVRESLLTTGERRTNSTLLNRGKVSSNNKTDDFFRSSSGKRWSAGRKNTMVLLSSTSIQPPFLSSQYGNLSGPGTATARRSAARGSERAGKRGRGAPVLPFPRNTGSTFNNNNSNRNSSTGNNCLVHMALSWESFLSFSSEQIQNDLRPSLRALFYMGEHLRRQRSMMRTRGKRGGGDDNSSGGEKASSSAAAASSSSSGLLKFSLKGREGRKKQQPQHAEEDEEYNNMFLMCRDPETGATPLHYAVEVGNHVFLREYYLLGQINNSIGGEEDKSNRIIGNNTNSSAICLNPRDWSGRTPLEWLACSEKVPKLKQRHRVCAEILIQYEKQLQQQQQRTNARRRPPCRTTTPSTRLPRCWEGEAIEDSCSTACTVNDKKRGRRNNNSIIVCGGYTRGGGQTSPSVSLDGIIAELRRRSTTTPTEVIPLQRKRDVQEKLQFFEKMREHW